MLKLDKSWLLSQFFPLYIDFLNFENSWTSKSTFWNEQWTCAVHAPYFCTLIKKRSLLLKHRFYFYFCDFNHDYRVLGFHLKLHTFQISCTCTWRYYILLLLARQLSKLFYVSFTNGGEDKTYISSMLNYLSSGLWWVMMLQSQIFSRIEAAWEWDIEKGLLNIECFEKLVSPALIICYQTTLTSISVLTWS